MDALFLLIPLSVVLVFIVIVVLGRAVSTGQFDDLENKGLSILTDPDD